MLPLTFCGNNWHFQFFHSPPIPASLFSILSRQSIWLTGMMWCHVETKARPCRDKNETDQVVTVTRPRPGWTTSSLKTWHWVCEECQLAHEEKTLTSVGGGDAWIFLPLKEVDLDWCWHEWGWDHVKIASQVLHHQWNFYLYFICIRDPWFIVFRSGMCKYKTSSEAKMANSPTLI